MRYSNRLIFVAILALPAIAQAAVQPGMWETTTTVQSIDMPGAPPQVAAMMRGKANKQRYCLTAEQAAKGPQELLKSNQFCRFTKYSMTGGTISTEMVCNQQGGTLTARAAGSYTPNSFTTTSSATMVGKMSMKMTSVTSGRRLGPCQK